MSTNRLIVVCTMFLGALIFLAAREKFPAILMIVAFALSCITEIEWKK